MKIKIHSDLHEDVGTIYTINGFCPRENSTAVELNIDNEDGSTYSRVVPSWWIEVIE